MGGERGAGGDRARWVARALLDLAEDVDLSELLARLIERCIHVVGPTDVFVLLADGDGTLEVLATNSERPQGDRAGHIVLLEHGDALVGVVHVLLEDGRHLAHDDAELLQSLADMATSSIMKDRALRHAEVLAEQLQDGLRSRVTLEQAKGMLAERLQVEVGVAFDLLRSFARTRNLQLSDVGQQLVDGTLTAEVLLAGDRRRRRR